MRSMILTAGSVICCAVGICLIVFAFVMPFSAPDILKALDCGCVLVMFPFIRDIIRMKTGI